MALFMDETIAGTLEEEERRSRAQATATPPPPHFSGMDTPQGRLLTVEEY